MTSKALLHKFHPSLNLYRYSVKRTFGLTLLMTVFMLLICPGFVVTHINNRLSISETDVYNFDKTAPTLILGVMVVTCAASLIYLFINFSFLYSRSGSDFFHSLPLKRSGMLASRFLASIVPILLPLTLTYASMCGILALDYVEGSISLILTGFVYNILILIMCAAFSLIFIVCAGSIFDLIISFVSFNVGVILLQIINSELCRQYLWGYPNNAEFKLLMLSTPFVYAFEGFFDLFCGIGLFGESYPIFTAKLVIITLLSLAAAFLLYKRRKSEKSGVAYAYRFIYIVCAIIVGVIGAYIVGIIFSEGEFNFLFWIFAVVGGLLSAVTFGAINDRGFKTVKKSLIIGGGSVLCMAAFSLCLWSGFFGYTSRIPSAERIETASVSVSYCSTEFTDPDLVMKLHNEIIAQGGDKHEYDYVYISYKLKNGQSFERDFYINYNDHMDTLLEIYRSEENINGIKKEFEKFTDNNLAISVYTEDDSVQGLYLTAAEFSRLKEAYFTDISSATKDSIHGGQYMTCEISGFDKNYRYLRETLYIEKGFKNTIEVIDSLNLKDRAASEDGYADEYYGPID